jgi:3-hydroxyacyl-CoA dehydrogenase / enoyl-CoA hydratase / 3-hydroxybutyryl-CoA epimerase
MLFESPSIRVEADDQIATLWIDCPGRADNRLGLENLDDLEAALREIRRVDCLDVLVVRSAKPSGFSPGYDLEQIARLGSAAERTAFAARGQQVLQLLANLAPGTITVALIDGECRSAGLEIALACDYRLVVARPETRFGFPELSRELLPCWGGTQRLPRLIGMKQALEMLLRGREYSGWQAVTVGLADRAFDEKQSRIGTQTFLDRLQDSPRRLTSPRCIGPRWRDSLSLGRWLNLKSADAWLADVNEVERPAARAILRAVWSGYSSPAEALTVERGQFAQLLETAACRHALALARRADLPARIHPEPVNPAPQRPERVGVVGGGEMGAALAAWFALRGRQVVLQEYNDETLQSASDRLEASFQAAGRAGLASAVELDQAKKNVRRTTNWNGFEKADFVIEAVDEDPGMKRQIFHELEQRVRPRTILTTASSTIRVEAIQAELQRPGRVAGVHFLDAALANPIVEIVRSPATDPGALAALDTWFRAWGKAPVLVGDRPGRLVQRITLAYLSEAVLLTAEGLPPELIDRAARRFGMKQGPLATIDEFGFDKLARLVENLQLARGDNFASNLLLDGMRAYGWNGQASGEGFYRYRGGRVRPNHLARMVLWRESDEDVVSHYVFDPQESLDEGLERLMLRTINEAAACLPDEPDADPGLIDLALSLGAGWAPHRGGPLRHADRLGLTAVVERLTEFTERFGKRFEPCVELQRRSEAGESFYEAPIIDQPAEGEAPFLRRLAG